MSDPTDPITEINNFQNIWISPQDIKYDSVNNTKVTTLTFSQQVEEYRYMILYWTPSPEMSYMQYLSQIALTMIMTIRQFLYYRTNNLEDCSIYNQKYYIN